jgi:phosphate transport system substrate-binding protein
VPVLVAMPTVRPLLPLLVVALTACTRPVGGDDPTASTTPYVLGPASRDKNTVTLKGSDTMVIVGERWAEEYMKEHPEADVRVTGGGSGDGIASLINGSADICESSRRMTAHEWEELKEARGAEPVETIVAEDAVAVYVNAENPVRELSLDALARAYEGKTKRWNELGGDDGAIVLYGRETSSGTHVYFKEHVLGGEDFAVSTETLAGTSAVVSAVKGDIAGVGYGGIAYAEGVVALSVRRDAASPAVKPSLSTAQDGSYPLSRALFFYTAGEPLPATKRFIAWVVGAEGQRIVTEVGFYPLPNRRP